MRLTVSRTLSDDVVAALYPTYAAAFDFFRTRAAARHMITDAEFAAEMVDERIEKYIVWDDLDVPIALTTLTNDLTAIPWISSEYYTARYPDAVRRGALFYLGYILVETSRRSSKAMIMMTTQVNRRLREAQGVLGFDVCNYNDGNGIGRHARRLLASSDTIEPLDTQSYYAADYRGLAAPADGALAR